MVSPGRLDSINLNRPEYTLMCLIDLWCRKDKAKCVEWGVKYFLALGKLGNFLLVGRRFISHINFHNKETLEILYLGSLLFCTYSRKDLGGYFMLFSTSIQFQSRGFDC